MHVFGHVYLLEISSEPHYQLDQGTWECGSLNSVGLLHLASQPARTIDQEIAVLCYHENNEVKQILTTEKLAIVMGSGPSVADRCCNVSLFSQTAS